MSNRIYAMDFSFYTTFGVYPFEAQCEMLQELGYDGIEQAVWDGTRWPVVEQLATVQERYGLDPVGVYVVLNLDLPLDHPHNAGILVMLENIIPGTKVDLAIQSAGGGLKPSSRAGDPIIVGWLKTALAICERRGVELLLYPHVRFWMERHSDALRLCQELDHPNLGIVLVGIHWYAEPNRREGLGEFLDYVYPYVRKVHLSGFEFTPLGWGGIGRTMTLGTGELDNFALVSGLKNRGYEGMFGFLSWEDGGDPYPKLKTSREVLTDMIERAERHPNWAGHI